MAMTLKSACAGCDVGAAHVRGETPERWPDGSPVVQLSLSTDRLAPVLRSKMQAKAEAKAYRVLYTAAQGRRLA